MNKVEQFLTDWARKYAEHRDIIRRSIIGMEQGECRITVKHKDRLHVYFIMPVIHMLEETLSVMEKGREQQFTIVTLNARQNLERVVNSWSKLITFPTLSIIFVNPFSQTDTKWIVHPHTHNKITESSALKTGLKSLFDGVEEIDPDEFQRKI